MNTKTDKQRIAAAFRELRKKKYFARMYYSCCQTCGFYEAFQTLKEQGKVREDKDGNSELLIPGVVFYHMQDAAALDREGNLKRSIHIAHECKDPNEVVAILKSHGLNVLWNGDERTRFALLPKEGILSSS